jgi:DNA-binding response OmpR family regulator
VGRLLAHLAAVAAAGTPNDRVTGLALDADDYLPKRPEWC